MSKLTEVIPSEKVAFYNNPQVRGYIFQFLAAAAVAFLFYQMYSNAKFNLENQKMASGFAFLNERAGFSISQTLIAYPDNATYLDAFIVSILNTLIVAVIGVFFATILGFLIGVGKLSKNFMINKICYWYVEIIRNLPSLFQLVFWYLLLIKILPSSRDSYRIADLVFLNQRGLYLPDPSFQSGFIYVFIAFLFGCAGSYLWNKRVKKRQEETGEQLPRLLPTLALILVFPILVFFLLGQPATLERPELAGFNVKGGISVIPELVALLIGLVTYTAAFIAEIVRSGVQSVYYGQSEAGRALGLPEGRVLRLIVIPQAMRVIIPPLNSQFLNLTKNSSLATIIGYPDMVAVGQTILNQSGHSIEIVAMWMAVYLTISLVTSFIMNWYNDRLILRER
jgi:general L-amino acid transport system permease protein